MASLDTLPTEIIFNILSFVSPSNLILSSYHPLYTIAATNRLLRSHVEEFTRILLKQHANFTVPKKSKIFVCRKRWIKWLDNTCQICKKKSVRKAILDPTLTCCAACDKANFPKMSMSAAITQHNLTKLDLFTPNALHPKLPPLTVGEYVCNGVDTTMISEPDVLARKELIHRMLRDSTKKALKKRNTQHTMLLRHMDPTIPHGEGRWARGLRGDVTGCCAWESLRTPESRQIFVREKLKEEWATLWVKGGSTDDAIELD